MYKNCSQKVFLTLLALLITIVATIPTAKAALTCTVSTTCASGVVIFRMASTSNSHAELPSQSNYANLVCCSGVTGLSNSCTGNFTSVLDLASVTNSHTEQYQQTNYTNSACLSAPAGNTFTVGYPSGSCTGYDATLGSMAAVTNSHVGDTNAYATQICATISLPQSLTFNLSSNTIGFGSISSAASRYATGDTNGNSTEIEAHTITAMTNGTYGYSLQIQGATLTSGSNTVTAIGGTATAPAAGTNQFGLRLTASGGTGAATSPYNTTGFADAATATTSSQVAGESAGDGVNTVYSMRYVANVPSNIPTGSYTTTLTYSLTANF